MGVFGITPEVRAPYSLGTIDCVSDKPFKFNPIYTVTSGARFLDENMDLCFPPDLLNRKYDQTKRSRFGPCVEHNGNIFTVSDVSIKYAVRRMTGLRFPDEPGKDQLMADNQKSFIAAHEQSLLEFFTEHSPSAEDFLNIEHEAIEHHADVHPKRALRIAAYLDACETGELWKPIWMREHRTRGKVVLYKAKKDEVAKINKYQRAIGDLGVFASLEGAWITKAMKNATDGVPCRYKGGDMTFIQKPSGAKLDQIFADLEKPIGRYSFYLHSDDSVLAIHAGGEIYRFNIDIAGCDASHSQCLFDLLVKVAVGHEGDMSRLVDQCRLPFMVVSNDNPKNRVVFETSDNRARLYSGSTLTTLINNLANYLIGMAIADAAIPVQKTGCATPFGPISFGRLHTASVLLRAITETGYVCTLETCEILEDVQFLKNSPIKCTDGVHRSMLNLGVPLRASGTCKGDLPGRGNLKIRGTDFQAGLLRGFFPAASCTFINNMKKAAGPSTTDFSKEVAAYTAYKHISTESHVFDDASVYARYRLTDTEIAQVEQFSTSIHGEFSASPGLSKILEKDYGLSCINRVVPGYVRDSRVCG